MHVGVILQGNVVDLWERLAQEDEMLVVRSPLSSCVRRVRCGRVPGTRVSYADGGRGFLCTLQELGSDQTSLHNPYSGGYYPAGLSFDEANEMMFKDPAKFKCALHAPLLELPSTDRRNCHMHAGRWYTRA